MTPGTNTEPGSDCRLVPAPSPSFVWSRRLSVSVRTLIRVSPLCQPCEFQFHFIDAYGGDGNESEPSSPNSNQAPATERRVRGETKGLDWWSVEELNSVGQTLFRPSTHWWNYTEGYVWPSAWSVSQQVIQLELSVICVMHLNFWGSKLYFIVPSSE